MHRRPDWNHYSYVYGEDQAARVEFDVEAAALPTDPALQGLRFVIDEANEEALLELLAPVDGLHVGRLCYQGQCEHVLQASADVDLPTAAIEALGGAIQRTSGWDYFNDRVCPQPADWRRIEDREALERLDLDGDGELRVLHRFYGDAKDLDTIGGRLEPEGFEEVERTDDRLTLAHLHPIGDISRITVGLLRLCERGGVAYDGWVLPG